MFWSSGLSIVDVGVLDDITFHANLVSSRAGDHEQLPVQTGKRTPCSERIISV